MSPRPPLPSPKNPNAHTSGIASTSAATQADADRARDEEADRDRHDGERSVERHAGNRRVVARHLDDERHDGHDGECPCRGTQHMREAGPRPALRTPPEPGDLPATTSPVIASYARGGAPGLPAPACSRCRRIAPTNDARAPIRTSQNPIPKSRPPLLLINQANAYSAEKNPTTR